MALILAVPPFIAQMIQTGFIKRFIEEALQPGFMFRNEAEREEFNGEVGQTLTFSRRGLRNPVIRPLRPGEDVTPTTFYVEQYQVEVFQRGDSAETDLATSAVSIKKFTDDLKSLVQGARWTIDRVARNALFSAYCSGDTTVTTAGTSVTTVAVSALGGFRQKMDPTTGKLADVSATNALAITINGVANTVIGTLPNDADFPDGPGTLYVGTAVTVVARQRVLAGNRPTIVYPAGVTTGVDGLSAGSVLTLSMINQAVARLRADRVPTFKDGLYHMKADPFSMQQLLQDAATLQLFQGQPDSPEMRQGLLSRQLGVKIDICDDNPNTQNVSPNVIKSTGGGTFATSANALAGPEFGAEVQNHTSIPIKRSIIFGETALREFLFDEGKFMKEAKGPGGSQGFGYQGQMPGEEIDGVRYVCRPPIDAKGQVVTQTFTCTTGFVAPPDELAASSSARYKRGVTLVHA